MNNRALTLTLALSVVVAVNLSLSARAIHAQTPAHDRPAGERGQYQVEVRHVDRAPTIDGVLGLDEWRDAAVIDNFTQQEPSNGSPATERTEVRVLYDSRRLYIAVHAYDSNPAGVIATEMRRDSPRLLDEDNFQVILDTFRDSRSDYMFVTNPLGANPTSTLLRGDVGRPRMKSFVFNETFDDARNSD